jgi:hypothetical protein
MKLRHKLVALFISICVAAIITAAGAWAFAASIHDSATYLRAAVAITLPVATLMSRFDFLHSDLVYWLSLLAGIAFWLLVGYRLALIHLRRYPDVGAG